jgi:hypothetical protein
MMKKKGYKKGGVTKKMVGGAMKKTPVAMKKGGAPKTSLRPKARPLSEKEKERKKIDADMKRLRQKTAMTYGLDDYGKGKAVSEGKLRDKPAEKSESFLFTLPEEKKKGGAVKKMGGGMMKKKGYSKGGKMPMVKGKDGNMIPAFAADGKGKMKKGGAVKKKMGSAMKKKGYAKGGAMKKKGYAKGGKTVARGSGAARTQYFGKNG